MFIMIFTLSGMKHPVVQVGLNIPKHSYFSLDYMYLLLNLKRYIFCRGTQNGT